MSSCFQLLYQGVPACVSVAGDFGRRGIWPRGTPIQHARDCIASAMSHQVPGNTGATDRGVETRCTDGALGEPSATERGTERPRDANVAAHADASGSFTNDQRLGDPLRADAADCSQVLRVRSRLPPSEQRCDCVRPSCSLSALWQKNGAPSRRSSTSIGIATSPHP